MTPWLISESGGRKQLLDRRRYRYKRPKAGKTSENLS